MTEQTVYCEECVEDIPHDEVYWEEERLYCKRCGSEVEPKDRDIFEEIEDNRDSLIFRDDVDESLEDQEQEDKEQEEKAILPENGGEKEE